MNNDLGYLYADQGKNLEKAEAMIRKAVEEEPENGSYLDSLGWVLFKRGKAKEALDPLEKAAKGENLDFTICEHLGDVLFRLQDYARAKESWDKAEEFAAKADPPDSACPRSARSSPNWKSSALPQGRRRARGREPAIGPGRRN